MIVLWVGSVRAEDPQDAQLAFTQSSPPRFDEKILLADVAAARVHRLTRIATTLRGLSWFPDGETLSYGEVFGDAIYTVSADGGKPRPVPGTRNGEAPVVSPDGRTIAFARLESREVGVERGQVSGVELSTSIWLVDANGGRARPLLPRPDNFRLVPSSWSPDGTMLAATEEGRVPRAILIPLDGRPRTVIARNATEPVFSPDGSQIAFVRPIWRPHRHLPPLAFSPGGDLFVAASDGSAVRRLTFNPARREESPSWDPSGERLAYAQFPARRSVTAVLGYGSAIFEINADGTCRHKLLAGHGLSHRVVAWRLGPGREAGRIGC
jgi:Tol biopolymer transport system component